MLKKLKNFWKKTINKLSAWTVVHLGQGLLRLILWTCRIEVKGLPEFINTATNHKCILMLWHNCLALVPYALSTLAPQFIYAAFVSKSRDGELLSAVAQSYRTGRIVRVPHNARHQALREMIRRVEENREIVLITPDGPRGPRYVVKPGVALAAQATAAHVIPWKWSANSCWQLKTWDTLMIPKPFTKITITFGSPQIISKEIILKEAVEQLQSALINLD